MSKKRKTWLLVVSIISILTLTLTALVGCKKEEKVETFKVTFMVRENGTGDYQKYKEVVTNEDGSITFPDEPKIEGFSFRAWYLDENCSEDKVFNGKKIESDLTVYAFMSDKILTISIKDEKSEVNELKEQTVSSLDSIAASEKEKAAKKDLVFDGWYTNEDCSTPYTNESGATTIYGRYMAKVSFNNGYEDVKEELVIPGKTVAKPSINEIKKDYMDKDDIFFVNSEDHFKDFNFNDAVNKNTTVTILWKTPSLTVKPIKETADYMITGFETDHDKVALESYPVISIPAKVTVNNQLVNVAHVNAGNIYSAKSAKMVIFNDGIQHITAMSGGPMKSVIENIRLPKTLKILESSFNNIPTLKNIELPNGLEVILDCFWEDYAPFEKGFRSKGYENFEIVVPNSVNNISLVPSSLVYAEGSPFYNDGNRVYKNDEKLGKVLVSEIQADVDENRSLVLPEGIDAIQVGALEGLEFDFIEIPASFKAVSYNNELADYPYYIGSKLIDLSAVSNPDSNPADKGLNYRSYSIIYNLDEITYVKFNTNAYPSEMNKYAFNQHGQNYEELEKQNIIFVAEIEKGESVVITVNYVNSMTGEIQEVIIDDLVSGDKITADELLTKVGITEENLGYEFKVDSYTQFGQDVDFEKEITCNLYIDIRISIAAEGFTVEENDDGTLTVTGFNKDTAKLLDNGVSYLVIIPQNYNGKPIVAIKEGAFENNSDIGQIYISSGVKSIGDRAFKNTKNLELVSINAGGLEYIGEAAFEYAGSIMEGDLPVINPQFTQSEIRLVIKLPIGTLKEIGPNAFNTPALKSFTAVEEEKSRPVFTPMSIDIDKLEPQSFYFQCITNGLNIGIVKVLDKTPVIVTAEGIDYEVYDVEYCATAAGIDFDTGTSLTLGMNNKFMRPDKFLRYTVKTGSVALYGGQLNGVTFANVLKVEKGAFTYLHDRYLQPTNLGESRISYAVSKGMFGDVYCYTPVDVIKTQDTSIFEDGWYMNRPNSENNYFMSIPQSGGSTPGWS